MARPMAVIGRILCTAATVSESLISALPGPRADLSQSQVFTETENRPWPVPEEPWLMAQTWRDLLFAHWPLPADLVRQALPPALPVDTYDGWAWIGVTPFEVTGLRPRGGLPLPGSSRFPELDVRTYTTVGGKPGIYFLSLDYCLYTVDETGRPLRGEIQHPPWPLQRAEASITVNTMTVPWGIELPSGQPLLHFSRLQRVVIWPLRATAP